MKHKGLDPYSENFKYMGEKACRRTVMFITPKGQLVWVPFETMRIHFRENIPSFRFEHWLNRLTNKEFK